MMKAIIFSFLIGVTITIKSVKPENLYSLTVTVNNLRNSDGTMIFALYNENGSIPDQKFKKYYRKETVRIVGKKSEITFNNLPQGLYAVTILHDENNNEKIDTKFMLPLPKEGVGFSNYEDFGLSNKPNFSKASFQLIKNTTIAINVIYK